MDENFDKIMDMVHFISFESLPIHQGRPTEDRDSESSSSDDSTTSPPSCMGPSAIGLHHGDPAPLSPPLPKGPKACRTLFGRDA